MAAFYRILVGEALAVCVDKDVSDLLCDDVVSIEKFEGLQGVA